MKRPPRPGPRAHQRQAARPPRPVHGHGHTGGSATALDGELCVVGRHPVEAVLEHQRARAERLYVQGGEASAPLVQRARRAGVPVDEVDGATLDTLAGRGLVHQGVVLRCAPYPYVAIEELERAPDLTLVLDGVEDPRNLGAAARAAFALGASLVVVPHDRAAACTASAHKAAAGALSQLSVARVGNLRRALEQLKDKGAWLVGAEADAGQAPWQVDLRGPVAVIVGGEDRGLRRLTREACDFVVAIPMATTGTSLNAADAATVLLYEALRQRRVPPSP